MSASDITNDYIRRLKVNGAVAARWRASNALFVAPGLWAIIGSARWVWCICIFTTNLLLHGIEVPSMIEHGNTLARGWDEWRESERVASVITNPSFGGMEDDTVGSDYPLPTRDTADLFMTLIVNKLLKEDGGRAAVVLPDGFLFGDGIKAKIKEELLETCHATRKGSRVTPRPSPCVLTKYKQLLAEIEQTQKQLRDELAEALAYRFQ